ncbi:OmpA family protein [Lysobacter sp. F6437]|uniref:OmpA family protein n=1 Tax=Lysobacter sp. F6437 TaxID=3459296 RepID=UPI00403D9E00
MACLLLLALAGCEKPVLSADPAAGTNASGGRPVPTLGPDDAIRSAADTAGPAPRPVSAGQMKRSIDADGKVALQVNFDTDKATLQPDADPLVEQIASLLRRDPALRLSIEGHTDAHGEASRNRALSRQRAETVRAALIVKGIDARRLRAQGFGADRPVIGNESVEAHARNQRIELVRLD